MTAQEPTAGSNAASAFDRLPETIRDTLTPEQADALANVPAAKPDGAHPVDMRFTLPLPGRPMFFTLVAGHERRSAERQRLERRRRPLHTVGNALFVLTSLAGIYAIAMFAALLMGSIIEI